MKLLAPLATVVAILATTATTLVAGPASASAEPVPVPARELGVALPGAPYDLAEVDRWSEAVGRRPDSLTWYVAWAGRPAFPAAQAAQVAATGAVPAITWEPWDPAAGTTQPTYSLARIAAGRHDSYLASWAKQVRSYGGPVVLRFAHEMNGNWYPWAAQANGNTASDYVAAWRHVRGVFDKNRVTNVRWTWSPNVPYEGSTDLAALYPGDAYVDRVALDGYNWGATQTWSTWQSFEEIFGPGIAQLQALSDRPIHVAEVGSTEVGGDKAAWMSEMFAYLAAHPEVRGFTWFDFAKESDWRVASSEGSLAAFRAGLATVS